MLNRVGAKTRSVLTTVEGRRFLGQILDPPDTSRVTNFLSARRYLRVLDKKVTVKPGDVILAFGDKYIVADHASGFYVTEIYKHFKLFQVTEEQTLYRESKTPNPVTGLLSGAKVSLGTVSISSQPKTQLNDGMEFSTDRHQLILNTVDVNRGDELGSYIVEKVDIQLGVGVVNVKEVR